MRIQVVVVTITALLVFTACGGGDEEDEGETTFANVSQVVEALDKHNLINEYRPRVNVGQRSDAAIGGAGTYEAVMRKYRLHGAKTGSAFIVEGVGYGIEIYIYEDRNRAVEFSEGLRPTGRHMHLEGNMALILQTSTEADLSQLVADLND